MNYISPSEMIGKTATAESIFPAKHSAAISTEAGQKLRCVIKDFVKPYNAENGAETVVSTLCKLDDIDKHRLILTLLVKGTVKSRFCPNWRFENHWVCVVLCRP
jgi:hypothetical protein